MAVIFGCSICGAPITMLCTFDIPGGENGTMPKTEFHVCNPWETYRHDD